MMTWYVVFCESDTLKGWKVFTEPGFEHVCAFAQSEFGVVLHDYSDGRIVIRTYPTWTAEEFAIGLRKEGKIVLKVKCPEYKGNYFRALLYCVPLVKSCLGVRGCWALTPKGLYRWLIKQDYVKEL